MQTAYGRGRVLSLTSTSSKVVFTNWRLANGSKVHCYLPPENLTFVRKKKFGEMTSFDKIDAANEKREVRQAEKTIATAMTSVC